MATSSKLEELEITAVDIKLQRIEEEVAKLRQSVIEGRYDARSLVGDAVLVIEGQLKQIRKYVPKFEDDAEPA